MLRITGNPAVIRPADRLMSIDGIDLSSDREGVLVEHVSVEHILGSDIGVRNVTIWGRSTMVDLRLTHDLEVVVCRGD